MENKEDHPKPKEIQIEENPTKEKDLEEGNNTDIEQRNVQSAVEKILQSHNFSTSSAENFDGEAHYFKSKHYNFAKNLMFTLPSGYMSLDSGMPWFPYWVLNIIEMCKDEYELSREIKMKLVQILKELQHSDGGFSGNAKGIPHLISTYAAMMAIVNLGIKEAYEIVNIPKMRNFLLRMKNNNFDIDKSPSFVDKNGTFLITRLKENNCSTYSSTFPGAFSGHYNGESDLRATYCGLVVASILNIMDEEIIKGVVDNIKNCQSYEGGFAPEPFCEAHGGYSYCAIASLLMLNKLHEVDIDSFLRWLVNRQMTVEGGFNGRTNKLVDSCYSFWQGSIFNMLYMRDKKYSYDMELLYDQLSLQAYILFCCQMEEKGGLIDKPGKSPDLFHTNYATAGFILSQECFIDKCKVCLSYSYDNEFMPLNPIYCAPESKVKKAKSYYSILK